MQIARWGARWGAHRERVGRRPAPRYGKSLRELVPVGPQKRAVMARVGKHQDQRVDAAVPQLEREASLEGLEIARSRLGFDADPPALAADMPVPRAKVAGDRKRDFHAPAERAVEAPPEPTERRRVGAIADRLARGVCTRGQLEPDDRQELAQHRDRDVRREAALDPANLWPPQSHCATDLGLA